MEWLVATIYRLKNWLKSVFRKPWKAATRTPSRLTLIAARTVRRFVPQIGIDRDILYPPIGVCASTEEWVSSVGKAAGADFRAVDVRYMADHVLPKTVHREIRRQFLVDEAYPCPATFVARIPNGRVLGEGLIITEDNQLLDDISITFGEPLEAKLKQVRREWAIRPLSHLNGTVAVLSTAGAMLYYHWLFQLLPRFHLIERSGIDLHSIDYFVVNSAKAPFQRESLEALKIDHRKIIESSKVPYLRATTLIVPSVPLGGGCYAVWMREFLRQTFLGEGGNESPRTNRRLYISRGSAGYRRVLNEPEVVRFLDKYGFEQAKFEAMSVRQQAATIASCEAIVAPHGGGLSNLIFCRPATKVIEIYSPELVAGYFWKISTLLGLDYYYLLGKGSASSTDTDYPQTWDAHADIEVDLDQLQETLARSNLHPVKRPCDAR
jgi:capsular polysaccharide biosynthesis protein